MFHLGWVDGFLKKEKKDPSFVKIVWLRSFPKQNDWKSYAEQPIKLSDSLRNNLRIGLLRVSTKWKWEVETLHSSLEKRITRYSIFLPFFVLVFLYSLSVILNYVPIRRLTLSMKLLKWIMQIHWWLSFL